jgi:hypothetical protein
MPKDVGVLRREMGMSRDKEMGMSSHSVGHLSMQTIFAMKSL